MYIYIYIILSLKSESNILTNGWTLQSILTGYLDKKTEWRRRQQVLQIWHSQEII